LRQIKLHKNQNTFIALIVPDGKLTATGCSNSQFGGNDDALNDNNIEKPASHFTRNLYRMLEGEFLMSRVLRSFMRSRACRAVALRRRAAFQQSASTAGTM